jgi:hypothetical protein
MRVHGTLGVLSVLALAGAAQATVIYSNDFENAAPGPEWANGYYSSAPAFSQFMGRYGTTDSTSLTIPAVTPPGGPSVPIGGGGGGGGGGQSLLYTVTFDFYPIDSWDGTSAVNGPDLFELRVNGNIIFNEPFSNHSISSLQSFRAPDVGPTQLGFGTDADSIYRNIAVDFTVDPAATSIQIKFRGSLTQPISDESWGIDNVRVSYTTVPTAGTGVLLAMGGVLAARRRR